MVATFRHATARGPQISFGAKISGIRGPPRRPLAVRGIERETIVRSRTQFASIRFRSRHSTWMGFTSSRQRLRAKCAREPRVRRTALVARRRSKQSKHPARPQTATSRWKRTGRPRNNAPPCRILEFGGNVVWRETMTGLQCFMSTDLTLLHSASFCLNLEKTMGRATTGFLRE